MAGHGDLAEALTPIVGALERLGVAWYVGGSVASTVHGRFRATNDVDLVAELRDEHAAALAAELAADHYASEDAIRDAVRRSGSFNVIHLGTGLKIDVFVPRADAFAEAARNRRERADLLGSGSAQMWVASAEDVVLTKLAWFRAGGGTSERQWRDVLGVIEVRGDALDREYLRRWAPELGVADLLAAALERRPRPPAA